MPELPEVEQLVIGVRRDTLGARFCTVKFFRESIREPLEKDKIVDATLNHKILSVRRRGKYMIVVTEQGGLGVHLGMSGKFLFSNDPVSQLKHTHVTFELTSKIGARFYYHFVDPRRFGRVFPMTSTQVTELNHPFLKDLGVEPLDSALDLPKHLLKSFSGRKVPIKSAIMNSEIMVGVGNIYASESLWRAKISPFLMAKDLSKRKAKILSSKIIEILKEAIELGGTTIRDYRDSSGNVGKFKNLLSVYERDGLPCERCRSPIQKAPIAGRSTYFCQVCQK